jgi:glutamyl-tRNA reductase
MQLVCLSISHHRTPLELRECLSLPPQRISETIAQFPVRAGEQAALLELAVLSTCNRMETYALVNAPEESGADVTAAVQPVLNYLQGAFRLPVAEFAPYLQLYTGDGAVEHLFQVAAGLDSIALGETQILGQVSRALETALGAGSARHVLSSLFRAAIHAGKRVHAETGIGRHPTSLALIAVQMAMDVLGSLAHQRVLVVGIGKMGKRALRALNEAGVQEITLTNRTYSHAAELAQQTGGKALPFERLAQGVWEADLIFTSTSASGAILTRELIAQAMAQRPERPLTLIDLSVPRNVDPAARGLEHVRLYDMDDLQSHASFIKVQDDPELAAARAIAAAEAGEYQKLLKIVPFIGELHKKIEQIRQSELERALKKLHNPDPQVSEQFELFSRSLVRKILHEPTMHLRSEADQATLNEYVDALTRLFDLSEGVDTS